MGMPKVKERRRAHRRRTITPASGSGAVPVTMHLAGSGRPVPFQPVDVSHAGLGILSAAEILPEIEVILSVGGTAVRLELAWGVQPDKGSLMMRYGFRALDGGVDLDALMLGAGC